MDRLRLGDWKRWQNYCRWCGDQFEPNRHPGGEGQKYCSPLHAKKASKQRRNRGKLDKTKCSTPDKRRFKHRGTAVAYCQELQGTYYYECKCGYFHLTRRKTFKKMKNRSPYASQKEAGQEEAGNGEGSWEADKHITS